MRGARAAYTQPVQHVQHVQPIPSRGCTPSLHTPAAQAAATSALHTTHLLPPQHSTPPTCCHLSTPHHPPAAASARACAAWHSAGERHWGGLVSDEMEHDVCPWGQETVTCKKGVERCGCE